MLRTALLHPAILHAVASSGHGAMILIADGHYPLSTGSPSGAARVYLNLAPGIVSVTQVLAAILSVTPVEAAHVMRPETGDEPAIFADFRRMLPAHELLGLDRFSFYDRARTQDVALAIATGDQRLYANILLTIGVRQPD